MENVLKKLQDKIQQNLKLKKRSKGSKYFAGVRRGEIAELMDDLSSNVKEKQKSAVKRIIANMSLGRDVSSLFVDVVKLGQTFNVELKKLVYLYIINTAKMQSDKALLAVNTFIQDSNHPSPVIRALAIRTMMCMRVNDVTEYTLEPLQKGASDPEPYVRKTAAIGIGKLFHQNQRLFTEHGFLDLLLRLLEDNYHVVSCNAAVVLNEICCHTSYGKELTSYQVSKLINALTEASEWGQIYIMETIAQCSNITPSDSQIAIERVIPRLVHTNNAVVMTAIKLISVMLFKNNSEELFRICAGRISSAFLSMTKSDPETQFVVCKNVKLIISIFSNLLRNDIDSFFLRFNDPSYVKLEKLSILISLTNETNVSNIIKEFMEYTTEVDVLFVKEVVAGYAKIALKVKTIAPVCVEKLISLAGHRPEMLPSIVIAAKNIVRTYPELFFLDTLIREHAADTVNEEEAKVAFIWMLGEFIDFLENGWDLIQPYLDNVLIHEPRVQMSILTAIVKIFLRNPDSVEPTLTAVLETFTQKSKHPDIRDRAYFYWRLLSKGIGVEKMKRIVHCHKPPGVCENLVNDSITPKEMLFALNTAAAVFSRPPLLFLPSYGLSNVTPEDEEDEDAAEIEVPEMQVGTVVNSSSSTDSKSTVTSQNANYQNQQQQHFDPFSNALQEEAKSPTQQPKQPFDLLDSVFNNSIQESSPLQNVFEGQGMTITACISIGEAILKMNIANTGLLSIKDFVMQMNRNLFGYVPAGPIADYVKVPSISQGQNVTISIPLCLNTSHYSTGDLSVEIGLKTSVGLSRFFVPIKLTDIFVYEPPLEKTRFTQLWRALEDNSEMKVSLGSLGTHLSRFTLADIAKTLNDYKIYVVLQTSNGPNDITSGSCRFTIGPLALFELFICRQNSNDGYLSCKCPEFTNAANVLLKVLEDIFIKNTKNVVATQVSKMTVDDIFS